MVKASPVGGGGAMDKALFHAGMEILEAPRLPVSVDGMPAHFSVFLLDVFIQGIIPIDDLKILRQAFAAGEGFVYAPSLYVRMLLFVFCKLLVGIAFEGMHLIVLSTDVVDGHQRGIFHMIGTAATMEIGADLITPEHRFYTARGEMLMYFLNIRGKKLGSCLFFTLIAKAKNIALIVSDVDALRLEHADDVIKEIEEKLIIILVGGASKGRQRLLGILGKFGMGIEYVIRMGEAGHLGDHLDMASFAIIENFLHFSLGEIIVLSHLDMDGVLGEFIASLRPDRLFLMLAEDLAVFDPALVDLGMRLVFKAAAELQR